jgi:hypothetical protein
MFKKSLITVAIIAGVAACSDPVQPAGNVQVELGLLQGQTLNNSVSVPSGAAADLNMTILVRNLGSEVFKYSGNTTASFFDGTNTVTRREFRGFEVHPGETKNIGTIPVAIIPSAAGTQYKLKLEFEGVSLPHSAEANIKVL